MKKLFLSAFVFINFLSYAQSPVLKSGADSLAYAIGVNIGQSFKVQSLTDLNLQLVMKGIEDYAKYNKPAMTVEQCNMFIGSYMQREQDKKLKENKRIGEEFLAKNKTRAGVQTTESGLQYEIMTAGTGVKPTSTDRVKVHYHGTLIDGTVFDSSVQRNEPIVFAVTQVIQGWTEALQIMPVGSKWKVFIPSHLAYRESGAGQLIGPNAALIFDIELIAIEK